jgi:hypothetical protein
MRVCGPLYPRFITPSEPLLLPLPEPVTHFRHSNQAFSATVNTLRRIPHLASSLKPIRYICCRLTPDEEAEYRFWRALISSFLFFDSKSEFSHLLPTFPIPCLDPTWWWRQMLSPKRRCKYGSWNSRRRLSSYSRPQSLILSDITCLFSASSALHPFFYSQLLHFL